MTVHRFSGGQRLLRPRMAVALGVLLTLGFAAAAAPGDAAPVPLPQSAGREVPVDANDLERIDRYLDRSRQDLGWPGLAAALVSGGEVVWSAGYGTTGPNGVAVSADTPFLIASVSKSLTAVAAMRLVDAGVVDLDDPVTLHLPELAPAGDALTVTDLMFQRTGITGRSDTQAMTDPPTASLAVTVERLEPLLRPGADFEYANGNYDALALLVERAAGVPFETYLQDEVFGPLDMSNATTDPDLARAIGLADGHYRWLAAGYRPHTPPLPDGTVGSYRMFASAEDLTGLLLLHLGGGAYGGAQVLEPASVELLQRGLPMAPGTEYSYGGGIVVHPAGSSWMTGPSAAYPLLEHDGSALAYRSYVWAVPGADLGLVLLTNANDWSDESFLPQVGINVREMLFDGETAPLTSRAQPLNRWGKHIFAVLAVAQVGVTVAALRAVLRVGRCRPLGRRGAGVLVATMLLQLLALSALLWLAPAVADAPLRAIATAPDARLILGAMVLGLALGLGAATIGLAAIGRPRRDGR